jgi:hypothetical protein
MRPLTRRPTCCILQPISTGVKSTGMALPFSGRLTVGQPVLQVIPVARLTRNAKSNKRVSTLASRSVTAVFWGRNVMSARTAIGAIITPSSPPANANVCYAVADVGISADDDPDHRAGLVADRYGDFGNWGEESRHTRIARGSKISRMPRHPAKCLKRRNKGQRAGQIR